MNSLKMNQNDNNQTDNDLSVAGQQVELGDLEPNGDVRGGADKLPPPTTPISSPPPPRK